MSVMAPVAGSVLAAEAAMADRAARTRLDSALVAPVAQRETTRKAEARIRVAMRRLAVVA